MQPLHVGVREAKAHLSRLLKMVQEGREVVLTDRGKPVGRIVPVEKTELRSVGSECFPQSVSCLFVLYRG